uniref:Retroviral polymerase SH3-like domain-containing protein n=1 Tax=Cajanus cajan TaxID=3821 RepID=A0A151UC76_CAJCA|nr:hypothetical protein KK1_021149 [Cajanus cajan]
MHKKGYSKTSNTNIYGPKSIWVPKTKIIGKFDSKIDEGILLGYSERLRAYRVFNNRTKTVEEAIHVKFDENKPDKEISELRTFFEIMQVNKNQSREDESGRTEAQQDDKDEREPVN